MHVSTPRRRSVLDILFLVSTHLREDKVTNHTSTCPWRTDNLIGSISLIEKSSATHFHEPSAGAHDGVHLFRVVDLQPPIHPMRCLPGHSPRVSHQRTMICYQAPQVFVAWHTSVLSRPRFFGRRTNNFCLFQFPCNVSCVSFSFGGNSSVTGPC